MDKIEGIIFDIDGVLVDAEEWHDEAFNLALVKSGYDAITKDVHKTFWGKTTLQKLEEISGLMNISPGDFKSINDKKQKIMLEIIHDRCKPNERVIEAIQSVYGKYKIGVATNCSESAAMLMLTKSQIYEYFGVIVTNKDTSPKVKPHPMAYSLARSCLKLKPEETLAIDDTHHGIMSALDAYLHTWHLKNFEDLTVDNLKYRIKYPKGYFGGKV